MNVEPVEVNDPQVVREIVFDLRVEAWKSVGVLVDGTFPEDVCYDEHDDHAIHWAVRDGSRVVAAARMCVHYEVEALPDAGFFIGVEAQARPPIASLNRLVVSPDHQRQGLSWVLDEIRIRKASELCCRSIWCVAPPIRWGPLQRHGFEVLAPVNLACPPRWLAIILAAQPPGMPEIPRKIMTRRL